MHKNINCMNEFVLALSGYNPFEEDTPPTGYHHLILN